MLIDSNILIDILRVDAALSATWRQAVLKGSGLFLSPVVRHELLLGANLARHIPAARRRTPACLDSGMLASLPLNAGDFETAAELRATVCKLGRDLGFGDALLAAQALNQRLVLVTRDKAFALVDGLKRDDRSGP